MNPSLTRLATLVAAASAPLAPPLAAQAGTVIGEQKISATQGGLVGPLHGGSELGYSLAHLGDIDGDGIADIASGTPLDSSFLNQTGGLFVLFLNADGTVKAEQRIEVEEGGFVGPLELGERLGYSLTAVGDLDGDGITELVSGTWRDAGGEDAGGLWVLFLDSDGTVKSEQKIDVTTGGFGGAVEAGDIFGHDLAALGDIDLDGRPELAVGAPRDDDGGSNRGAVWILSLNSDGTVFAETKISDTQGAFGGALDDGDQFGEGLGVWSDVDGNGVPELLVGAGRDDDGGTDKGALWVLFLDTDGSVLSEQKISETTGGLSATWNDFALFGFGADGVGDVDGDGVPDMVVGMPRDDDCCTESGAVFVLLMNANGTVKAHQKINNTNGGLTGPITELDQFGGSVLGLGDHDGDGKQDIAVGALTDDEGGTMSVEAFGSIYILNLDGTARAPRTIWTGASDIDWDNPANWTAGVPDGSTNAVVPAAPSKPDTSGAVDPSVHDLTVTSTAQLKGGTPLTVTGSALIAGQVQDGGGLLFTGTGSLTALGAIPKIQEVEVQGDIELVGLLPIHDLTLTSGTLTASFGSVTTVEGDATFMGGELIGAGGSLVLEEDVAFAGTVVTQAPDLRVLANWAADASFAPTSGTVTFEGDPASASAGGGATQLEFFDLVIASLADVDFTAPAHVRGDWSVIGDFQTTGTVDVDGDTDGDMNAAINLGTTGSTFGGDFTFGGSLSSAGMIVFDGPDAQFIETDTTLPDTDIDTTGTVTFQGLGLALGDLVLENGNLVVDTTTTVSGNSTFNGGTLTGTGLIDTVHVDFNGTVAAASAPDFRVTGNWEADANWSPTAGTVLFDAGAPGQTITLTGGATAARFHGLSVGDSAGLTLTPALDVDGDLTVNGTLAAGSSVDVEGDTSGDGDANLSLNLGGSSGNFGGDFTFGGSMSAAGMIVFDGSETQYIETDSTLPDVDVNATGTVIFGNLTVAGNLEVLNGTLEIDDSKLATVNGNGLFAGGFLRAAGLDDVDTGVLDINGGVTFSGTVVTASPIIRTTGNWTADTAYAPTTGKATFDNTVSSQTIDGTGGTFADVEVVASADVSSTTALTLTGSAEVEGDLTVTPAGGATFDVDGAVTGSGTLDVGTNDTSVGGDFTFDGTLTTDTVVFDGSETQTVNTTITLPDVEIAAVGTVSIEGAGLDISGSLAIESGDLELASGNTTSVAGTATWNGGEISGEGTLDVLALVINSGATIVLDGNGLVVDGNVLLQSGVFEVPDTSTVTVLGDLTLSGGSVTGEGVVDVSGDVVWNGATAGTPSFEVEGNWTVDEDWTPGSGTVTFDGAPPQVITLTGSATEALFHGFEVAFGSEITIAFPLVAEGPFTVDGTFSTTSSVDLNDTLAGAATGAITFQNGPLTVGGGFTFDGTLVGPTALTLDGTESYVLDTTNTLPPVTIDATGSYTAQGAGLLVNGDFDLVDGTLVIDSGAAISVVDSANLTGGSLSGDGELVVDDDVTFAGTSAAGTLHVDCGGAWNSDLAFAPTGGVVTFSGTGAQSVTVATSDFAFAGVTVGASSVVATTKDVVLLGPLTVEGDFTADSATTLQVGGALDVDGTCSASSATLNVSGSLDLDPGGDLTIGGGAHIVGGSYLELGTLTHPGVGTSFEFTASGPATLSAAADGSLPPVTVSGSGTFLFDSGAPTAITGDLAVTDGSVSFVDDWTIAGNANIQGSSWTTAVGSLDVAGDMDVTGVDATGSYDVAVAGDWTANASFAPTGGTVTLDGVGRTSIAAAPAGEDLFFHDLVLESGTTTLADSCVVSANSITVDAATSLDVGAHELAVAGGPLDVFGTLSAAPGGGLALGASVAATIRPGALLSLVGQDDDLAYVVGHAGGGYSFDVLGSIEAANYRFEEMGPAGIVIAETALIGTAPLDLRGGVFDRGSSAGGSVLLDLSRATPTTFRWQTFLDSDATGSFNVRTGGAGSISFVNWEGELAGPGFEDDPGGDIEWLAPDQTTISFFTATAAVNQVTLDWVSTLEVDITAYVVERRVVGAGSFQPIGEVTPVGPGAYQFVDSSTSAWATYKYRLRERLTHGGLHQLGSAKAEWFGGATHGTKMTRVNAAEGATALQAALDGVFEPGAVIAVEAGTYASFSIPASVPDALRVIALGEVVIDTSQAPVRIADLDAGRSLELVGLRLVGQPSAGAALAIERAHGLVLLDRVRGHSLAVRESTSVVMQANEWQQVEAEASRLAVWHSTADELSLRHGSELIAAVVQGSVRADASSNSVHRFEAPRLEAPDLAWLGAPSAALVHTLPETVVALFASTGLLWNEAGGTPPALLDPTGLRTIGLATSDAFGVAATRLDLPPSPSLAGRAFAFQGAVLEAGAPVFSNPRTVTLQAP